METPIPCYLRFLGGGLSLRFLGRGCYNFGSNLRSGRGRSQFLHVCHRLVQVLPVRLDRDERADAGVVHALVQVVAGLEPDRRRAAAVAAKSQKLAKTEGSQRAQYQPNPRVHFQAGVTKN